jgi:hypothetical protein
MTKWFGISLMQHVLMDVALRYIGFDVNTLCKIQAIQWAFSLGFMATEYAKGHFFDIRALVLLCVIFPLQVYTAFF